MDYSIYEDIAIRTGGDIYLGVVGPVRTGKSTFIKRFMDTLVIPNIQDENKRARAIDELPQSADGRTIMTTEPKFVPNEAVSLSLERTKASLRLIDCVGYIVEGAIGHTEGEKPRLVHTPWSQEEMPFADAAELGTEKVIKEHSTIGVLVTTDGSITELKRDDYIMAEERVVKELKALNKPFVIVLNCKKPHTEVSKKLAESLAQKYEATVIPMNVADADAEAFSNVIEKVLMEFPVKKVEIELPKWMKVLGRENSVIKAVLVDFSSERTQIKHMKDYERLSAAVFESEYLSPEPDIEVFCSSGIIKLTYRARDGVFYKVLSSECGMDIDDDYKLMKLAIKASRDEKDFGLIRDAMKTCDAEGYGIVNPDIAKTEIAVPELVKKGSQYGIKFSATATGYHIIKVDAGSEVCPTIGSEEQSEEYLKTILAAYDKSPESIWNTNIFGKSLSSIIMDDLAGKSASIPKDTQRKLRKTVTRIVNENRGGILCILI